MNDRRAYFLGSYNPLHAAHLAIAHHYEHNFGNDVTFVMSRNNMDKGSVTEEDLERRKLQFVDLDRKCEIVNARTFLGTICELKSKQWFKLPIDILVGVDTWNRILEPRCYFNSELETNRVLYKLSLMARFIVFPRDDTKIMRSKILDRVLISKDDFSPISISSTELRNQNA